MESIRRLIDKITTKSGILITMMGIALLISLIFLYINPANKITILITCIAGGFLNIFQGLRTMQDSKRKSSGMSYLMLGIIIIAIGFIIYNTK